MIAILRGEHTWGRETARFPSRETRREYSREIQRAMREGCAGQALASARELLATLPEPHGPLVQAAQLWVASQPN